MISIKKINKKDLELCFELDSNTISLWSKKQWDNELRKEGILAFGLIISNFVIGICVSQIVLDEAHINYFVIDNKFQRKGFGSHFMNYLINEYEKLEIKKLLLEVSESNLIAKKFYNNFQFRTVGIRKNYYKDGSDALLKEKKLIKK